LSEAAERRAGPGRPSTGARERILEAAIEVMKSEGYAGLSIAKVAASAGENKALIGYHFGSRQGLVAAAGREVGESITNEVVSGLAGAASVSEVVEGVLSAIWKVLDEDARIGRVYFDLAAVSVVEPDVRQVMREIRAAWRETLVQLLREADPGLSMAEARAADMLIRAGVEGLALERIEAGDSADLRRARALFTRSVTSSIAS
jgi:AcrR family transcriptional regulator